MTLSIFDSLAIALTVLCIALLIRGRRSRAPPAPHPPGPPGLPIIGNLLDIPPDPAWKTYLKWSKDYGSDLVRLNVLGENIVYVNSLSAATELLEKRSAIYSDRHEMLMLNELCGYGFMLAFQRYSAEWRSGRRAFHQSFTQTNMRQYRPIMLTATHTFLRNLMHAEKPDVMALVRHLAGSEIMRIAYGITVLPENDPYIETAEHALKSISATTNAGSYLVDILPILRHVPEWFPGANFQREAREWKASVEKMRSEPWKAINKRLTQGELPECAATSLIEVMERESKTATGFTEEVLKSALASMYTGASDTTVSTLGSFFLAMLLHPDIQEKAQREIDQVCAGRLPDFSDIPDLPYVDALIKESLRWNPVVPLNVAHRSIADDIYNGYYLPKDTLVVANIWSMLHDESIYPSPSDFNPDRFMKDGKINPEVRDPGLVCFGFGRRVCPGRNLAYESMWITIASTLATLTIDKVKNANGQPITPAGDYVQKFLCAPKAFECEIRPRTKKHEALVEATAHDV